MVSPLNIKILDIEEGGIMVSEVSELSELKAFSFPMVVELDIDAFDQHELKLLPILNDKERQRYITYKKWKDARRFILSRAALRLVLANFCNIPHQLLEFGETTDKKPYLIQTGNQRLEFNLSHTDQKIVIAIDHKPIGVDIESSLNAIRPEVIGPRVFNVDEQFSVANSNDVRSQFCLYWTRKEAFLKAIGKGIDDEIIKVPAMNGEHQFWVSNGFGRESWTVASLRSGDSHIFSLAYNSALREVTPNFVRLSKEAFLSNI